MGLIIEQVEQNLYFLIWPNWKIYISFRAIKILSSDLNLLIIPGSLKDTNSNKIIVIIYKIITKTVIIKYFELNNKNNKTGIESINPVNKDGRKPHGPSIIRPLNGK